MKTVWIMVSMITAIMWSQSVVSAELKKETDHLFQYLEQSGCQFVRNGKAYSGKEAIPHIKKKYDHYEDEIKTGEDFIRLSASRSLISKKPYWVRCTGKGDVLSQKWLTDELERYRKQ